MSDISRSDHASRMKLLLGPSAPELTCEECFDYLDRYVELELSGEDAAAAIPGMGPHLVGCPACGEDHDSLYALVSAEGAPSAPSSA